MSQLAVVEEPEFGLRCSSAQVEAEVAVKLGRRALDGRPFGVEFEGLGGGIVDLLPGLALAVVARLGWLLGREAAERFAVIVEVGGGAVPVRACGRVVGAPAEPVGDPVGWVAADVVGAALAGLFVAVVQLELGGRELDQLLAVAVEPALRARGGRRRPGAPGARLASSRVSTRLIQLASARSSRSRSVRPNSRESGPSRSSRACCSPMRW